MSHSIRIHQTGGADALKWEKVDPGKPAKGQVLLKQTAVGLNFIDVYQRTGLYPVGELPQTLGVEAAGIVAAVGPEVTSVSEGDRVAYAMALGAYSEFRIIDAERLIQLPEQIDDQTAAAMMLRGMTARYLLKSSYPVRPGDTILVMAAAGGVGSILCQWAKLLGAEVIGCVGSSDKAIIAKANGCDHVIDYRNEDIAKRVREITYGEGVAVSYDSVGQATLEASLDSLRATGSLISYGSASGAITNLNIGVLAQKGSLYVQRPTLATYTRNRLLLETCAGDLIDMVKSGQVRIHIGQHYALKDTAQAHRDLEARKTVGSTVLIP
ncbi:MAG: quinone oxidoreductase [Gammaproteobacteria bacterium]|nr:quinone oxidoreductase [Gammaproteobacteria bacterium]